MYECGLVRGILGEDAVHLLDCLCVLMCTVVGVNDQLRLRGVHMAAPIWDNPVGHLRPGFVFVSPFAPVAADHVMRDARGDRNRIDSPHEVAIRRKCIDAVWDTPQLHIVIPKCGDLDCLSTDLDQRRGCMYQGCSNATNTMACKIAASQWRGHEDDPTAFGAMSENEAVCQ